MWQPAIVPKPMQTRGVPIGFEQVTGRQTYLWLHNLNLEANYISIEGMKGSGKTTFMKSSICRFSIFQARGVDFNSEFFRSRVTSRKPNVGLMEYGPVLEYLEAEIHSLASSTKGFNVFGLFKTQAEVSVVAVFLAKHLAKEVLNPAVSVAILAGVHRMFQSGASPHPKRLESILRQLTYDDYHDFYVDSGSLVTKVVEQEAEAFPRTIGELSVDKSDVRDIRPENLQRSLFEARHMEAASEAADIFLNFVRGYGGIFMGEDSLLDVLSEDIVGLDEYGMADGAAEIFEAILNKAEANALSYATSEDALHLTKLLTHATWSDEEGEAMNSLFHARFKAQKVNKLRAFPTALVEAKQYHIQGAGAGEAGSEHRKYAQEIDFGVGARIIFRQPNSAQYLDKYREYGLPETYVELLPHLRTGQAIVFVEGREPERINHVLRPSEIPLVQTTQASTQMNSTEPITETEEWQERIRIQQQMLTD